MRISAVSGPRMKQQKACPNCMRRVGQARLVAPRPTESLELSGYQDQI